MAPRPMMCSVRSRAKAKLKGKRQFENVTTDWNQTLPKKLQSVCRRMRLVLRIMKTTITMTMTSGPSELYCQLPACCLLDTLPACTYFALHCRHRPYVSASLRCNVSCRLSVKKHRGQAVASASRSWPCCMSHCRAYTYYSVTPKH